MESLLSQCLDRQTTLLERLTRMQEHAGNHGKTIKLETFDGSGQPPFVQWSFHAREMLEAANLQPPSSLHLIMGALRGSALEIARGLREEIRGITTNQDFLDRLKELFVSPAHKQKAQAEFARRIQGQKEGIKVFHGLLKQLYHDAYDEEDQREAELIEHFIQGLKNRTLKRKLYDLIAINRFPTTYYEALDLAMTYMASEERTTIDSASNQTWHKPTRQPGTEPMDIGACRLHPRARHSNEECRQQNNGKAASQETKPASGTPHSKRKKDQCNRCGKLGHWQQDCKVKLNKPRSQNPKEGNPQRGAPAH